MALNVLWIRQRMYVWSCQKHHIYDFFQVFWVRPKDMLAPPFRLLGGAMAGMAPLDPPVHLLRGDQTVEITHLCQPGRHHPLGQLCYTLGDRDGR